MLLFRHTVCTVNKIIHPKQHSQQGHQFHFFSVTYIYISIFLHATTLLLTNMTYVSTAVITVSLYIYKALKHAISDQHHVGTAPQCHIIASVILLLFLWEPELTVSQSAGTNERSRFTGECTLQPNGAVRKKQYMGF